MDIDSTEILSDMEVLEIWKNEFIKDNRDIDEEIDDIEGTIDNEKLFQLGSKNEEESNCHASNIATLTEYLNWLKERKDS